MKKRQTRVNPENQVKRTAASESFDQFLDWLTDSPVESQAADSGERFGVFETLSDDALARFGAVPLTSQTLDDLPSELGTLSYDSWAGHAPAMRNITTGHLRRVQLKAGKLTLEIVAERQKSGWEFVARAYQGEKVRHDLVMKIGRQKFLPKADGFFHWRSGAVPRVLELLSYKRNFLFEELAW
jgi:hypothetical protein